MSDVSNKLSDEARQRVKESMDARASFKRDAWGSIVLSVLLIPALLILLTYPILAVTEVAQAKADPSGVTSWFPTLRENIHGKVDPELARSTSIAVLSVVISGIFALVAQGIRKKGTKEQVRDFLWQKFVFYFLCALSVSLAFMVLLAWIARPWGEGVDDLAVASVAAFSAVLFALIFRPSSQVSEIHMRIGVCEEERTNYRESLKRYFDGNGELAKDSRDGSARSYLRLIGYCLLLFAIVVFIVGVSVFWVGGTAELFSFDAFKAMGAIAAIVVILYVIDCAFIFYVFSTSTLAGRIVLGSLVGIVYFLIFGSTQLLTYYRAFTGDWNSASWLLVVVWTVLPLFLSGSAILSIRSYWRKKRVSCFFDPVWVVSHNFLLRGFDQKNNQLEELYEESHALDVSSATD